MSSMRQPEGSHHQNRPANHKSRQKYLVSDKFATVKDLQTRPRSQEQELARQRMLLKMQQELEEMRPPQAKEKKLQPQITSGTSPESQRGTFSSTENSIFGSKYPPPITSKLALPDILKLKDRPSLGK